MNDDNNTSFDYTILVRILSGDASPQDQLQFDRWMQEGANQKEFEKYSEIWETARNSSPKAILNLEADWQKVARQIEPKKTVRQIRPLRLWIAGVAASMLLLAGAYFVFSQQSSVQEIRQIVLADGSKVWLNRNATLDFPKEFKTNQRSVTLTGEAYFEIEKDERPFIINANKNEIRVLGTAFNVKSFSSLTEVTVADGRVQLSKPNSEEPPLLLEKSDRGTADAFALRKEVNPNPNYNSWRTGNFEFIATRLDQVAFDLSTYYDKPFRLQGADCLLTASFTAEPLGTVLDVLMHSCGLEAIEKKGEVVLMIGE